MFKAPIKMLHPLLTATQEGSYVGTENVGSLPYQGVIIAHSNESEWRAFRSNRNNEAFLDRICVVQVPYCLRVTEEKKIYEKLLSKSELVDTPCAPGTLEMLAKFSVLTRMKEHENSNLYSKLRVYDGESMKETDPHAKTVQEYRDIAGVTEGMEGASTRFAYKVLSETFNFDTRGSRRRPGASDVCARTGDPPRADVGGQRGPLSSSSSRKSWRRAMPSSSATRSRRRIWNPITNTARTCSTAMSPMPTPGSRITTSRTPIPAS